MTYGVSALQYVTHYKGCLGCRVYLDIFVDPPCSWFTEVKGTSYSLSMLASLTLRETHSTIQRCPTGAFCVHI